MLLGGKPVGQEQIDGLIGMGFAVFTNTILLGQDQPFFFDLQPQAKMNLFSQVLNLDRWDQRAGAAGKATAELDQEIARCEGELYSHDKRREEAQSRLDRARQQSKDWEAQRQALLAKAEGSVSELQKRIDLLQPRVDKADLVFDGAETESKSLRLELERIQEYYNQLLADKQEFVADAAVAQERVKVAKRQLKDLKGGKCPACGQIVKGRHLDRQRAQIEQELAAWSKRAEKGPDKAHDQQIADTKRMLDTLRASAKQFLEKADKAQRVLETDGKALVELRAELQQLEKAQREREEQDNPYRDAVQSARRELSQLEQDHRELVEYLAWANRKRERTRVCGGR